MSLAPKELAVIKREGANRPLEELVQELRDVDVVMIEGLRSVVKEREDIIKVVTVTSEAEAIEVLEEVGRIHAIVGLERREFREVPCVSIEELPRLIDDLVQPAFKLRKLLAKLPAIDCRLCGLPDCLSFAREVVEGRRVLEECPILSGKAAVVELDGKAIPLNPFVREVVRKTILGLVSTLRGIELRGNESVHVRVLKPSLKGRER